MYRFTFTWADDEVSEVIEESQWMAQNIAYSNRFGLGNTPTVVIVKCEIEALNA